MRNLSAACVTIPTNRGARLGVAVRARMLVPGRELRRIAAHTHVNRLPRVATCHLPSVRPNQTTPRRCTAHCAA
jgi:hypothetical protein